MKGERDHEDSGTSDVAYDRLPLSTGAVLLLCGIGDRTDSDGDVFIGALGEEPALVLRRQSDGGSYCTYIYEYEGALRELFLKEGAEVPPENGSVIAEIEAFSMEKISDGLFSFVCREESGETLTQLVSVRSQSAGGTGHE